MRASCAGTVKMRIGVISAGAREARCAVAATPKRTSRGCASWRLRVAGLSGRDRACAPGGVGGLSPKDNREVPPLRYDVVRRLKQAFPATAGGR